MKAAWPCWPLHCAGVLRSKAEVGMMLCDWCGVLVAAVEWELLGLRG